MNGIVVDQILGCEQLIKSLYTSSLSEAFSLSAIDTPSFQRAIYKPPLQRLHRRTGYSVAVQVVVDINQHTRISPLVESRRARTTRNFRTRPTDHQIHTLRVILRPIIAPTRMQRHNLMPQNIRPGLQRTRNRHRPRIITRHKIVRSPSTRRRTALEAELVDFAELEGGFVGCGAVVVGAGGEVVEDGAFVAWRPGVPEELHGLAGDNGDVGFTRFAGFVADYVGGLVAVGGDLAVLLVIW